MKKVNNIDILEVKKEHDLVFTPSPLQRAVKAKFWKRIDFDPSMADRVSVAGAIQLTGNTQLSTWAKNEGFMDWFLNKEEASERIEYLYMLWMDKAEELLLDPEANHNAVVQLGKIISQLSGRGENQERYTDEIIQRMDKKQLKAYIEKLTPKLIAAAKDDKEDNTGAKDSVNGTTE